MNTAPMKDYSMNFSKKWYKTNVEPSAETSNPNNVDSRHFPLEFVKTHLESNEKRDTPKEGHTVIVEGMEKLMSPILPPSIDKKALRITKAKRKRHSLKSNRQLAKELNRTSCLLECERAQNNALKERLEDVERQLKKSRNSRVHDALIERYSKRIRKLQEEVKGYQAEREEGLLKGQNLERALAASKEESAMEEYNQRICELQDSLKECRHDLKECRDDLERERIKSQELKKQAEDAEKANRKCQEKLELLMFQHMPSDSTKFIDIGPVNFGIHESSARVREYELGKKLGEGHFGSVQVGTNVASRKKFAIKSLNKSRIKRFKDFLQVGMEVQVLKQYPHPNIIHMQEVIHAEKNIYLVTELCLMDMHKYHHDIGLTGDGAKQVILGLLRPLQHLHSHGICHLDLKPENVLLSAGCDLQNVTYEDVRLCDFGLVNMAKNPKHSKEVLLEDYVCGTPGFFAPEMILRNEFEGRLADMWSLGCIILEVTLGFTQEWIDSYDEIDSDPSAFKQGLEDCLQEISLDQYPRHRLLLDIIHRCLTLDPVRRISSTEALEHPWLEEILVEDENREDFDVTTQVFVERSNLMTSAILC